jgi:hypothetical protein
VTGDEKNNVIFLAYDRKEKTVSVLFFFKQESCLFSSLKKYKGICPANWGGFSVFI